MEQLNQAWIMLKLGGIIILPLSLLGIIALAIMLEKHSFTGASPASRTIY